MVTRYVLGIIIATCLSAQGLVAQQKPTDDKAKKIAAVYELMKPGPEHKQLESLVGGWDLEMKFWMQPGAKPISMKAKGENRMILGGRFLSIESKGGEGAFAMESVIIIGFDRRHKKYTSVGFDTMGTYYVTAAGPYDESKQAIVMQGEDADPVLGHVQKYDMVLRIVSPAKYVTEIIFKDEAHTQGKEPFKAVEVTATRRN